MLTGTSNGLLKIAVALVWLASVVAAQTSSASFDYPVPETTGSPRLTINVFDTVNVEWESNYDRAWLYLWCDIEVGKAVSWFEQPVNITGSTSYSPSLQSDTSRDWSNPFACHFDLLYTETPNRGLQGPYFNITSSRTPVATTFARNFTSIRVASSAASTSSAVTSSSLASIATSPTAGIESSHLAPPSPTSTPSTNTNSASPSSSGGLSAGVKAGIAVGAVVGVVAIAGLAYLFYRNHRKLKELESKMPQPPPGLNHGLQDDKAHGVPGAYNQESDAQIYVPPQELGSHRPREELPGSL